MHDGCYESDVHAIEEISPAGLSVLVGIPDASHVDFPCAQFFHSFHHLVFLVFAYIPEPCEVVEQPVWYHAECNLLTLCCFYLHHAVHGIVQGRVATDDHDGSVAVVDEHFHQPSHAVARLTLNVIVFYPVLFQSFFHFLPPLFWSQSPCLWAEDDTPLFHINKLIY